MRSALLFILLVFLIAVAPPLLAQSDLQPEQWQEDVRYLQQLVHEKHPYLFKKVSADQFDQEVEKLYATIPTLEDHEVITGIARLVAMFGYGHTEMWLSGWHPDNEIGFRQMPYNLYYFSDGLYVEGVHEKYRQALGARVLKVGNLPVEEALTAIKPVVSAENDQYFKAFGITYLGTLEVLHAQKVIDRLDEGVTLTLEKDGEVYEVNFRAEPTKDYPGKYGFMEEGEGWLSARKQDETPLYLAELEKKYMFTYLPEQKLVYVRQSQVQDEESEPISDFYQRVFAFIDSSEVKKMVLDVRLNSGGNNYKNKPVVTGLIACEKINQPGKLFVVLGRRTFSACQNLVNELHNYTNAIFIGEPTAENINFYGDNNRYELPNSGLPVYLSFAWWQDKPEWENAPWLPPHIAVDMRFQEYRDNQDPVLETILAYDGSLNTIEPFAYLTRLYMDGEKEKVRTEARRLVQDEKYRYYDFESKFNTTGYRLLNQNQLDDAIFVFELNADLHPDSPNAWDSLAEAYWKSGNLAKAKNLYQKAISLDPEGRIGQHARSMLKKMEEATNQ